jgi:large subunit ribosomal protein L10
VALNLAEKKSIVAEVTEVAAKALSAVAAEYNGLPATRMTDLRAKARAQGVYLRVVKNTLARRALVGTEFECMTEKLVGPLVLAFSLEDPGAAARVIKAFIKDNPKFDVKVLAVGGKVLPASELERMSKLPTKEQAISLLMSVMKAPAEKLARTINEVPGKLVRTIAAIREQKEAA